MSHTQLITSRVVLKNKDYKVRITVTLADVLCGCTDCVIVVREERGSRAFPWGFLPEVEEATGG